MRCIINKKLTDGCEDDGTSRIGKSVVSRRVSIAENRTYLFSLGDSRLSSKQDSFGELGNKRHSDGIDP
jgi:hypothetical protein